MSNKTCFKYWHGPPEQKTCRFDLHEDNFRAISCFDPETGEIQLRCLNGLVNNFNATMIEALRNNMDIKFIGSGASAKGIFLKCAYAMISQQELSAQQVASYLLDFEDHFKAIHTKTCNKSFKHGFRHLRDARDS
ncbi:hypothetical protein B0H14DRAFT_3085829 [Mycena olivaceomarginata]|nr:hypothetical protein B0H14DRAFT_3085829 [Mycena olivaceomarginata]